MTLWRNIPGFPSYQASSDGQIRRSKPDIMGRKTWIGHVLKPGVNKSGYHRLWVTPDGGTRITRYVQSLVALVFIGPRPLKGVVHHKDGNKLNNAADNLEYVSRLDHSALHPKKLSREDVQEILRLRKTGWTQENIAKKFYVSRPAIGYVCRINSSQ